MAESTIYNDHCLPFHNFNDFIHNLKGVRQVIQGVTTMIGDHNGFCTRIDRFFGILCTQHTFKNQGHGHFFPDLLKLFS
jgi:hypothetical protein